MYVLCLAAALSVVDPGTAKVSFLFPDDIELSIGGSSIKSKTYTVRNLKPGRDYSYQVVASIKRPLTTTPAELKVVFQAGQHVAVGAHYADNSIYLNYWQVLADFGLDPTRVTSGERFSASGRDINKADATKAVLRGSLEDDSHKLRLTVIGSDAARVKVLADLNGIEVASNFLVQAYDTGDFWVKHLGFKVVADPTIYVQSPDGLVLHRQDGYDGPDSLAKALHSVYDPSQDPDRRNNPGSDGLFDWLIRLVGDNHMTAIFVVIILMVLVFRDRLLTLLGSLGRAATAFFYRAQPAKSDRSYTFDVPVSLLITLKCPNKEVTLNGKSVGETGGHLDPAGPKGLPD